MARRVNGHFQFHSLFRLQFKLAWQKWYKQLKHKNINHLCDSRSSIYTLWTIILKVDHSQNQIYFSPSHKSLKVENFFTNLSKLQQLKQTQMKIKVQCKWKITQLKSFLIIASWSFGWALERWPCPSMTLIQASTKHYLITFESLSWSSFYKVVVNLDFAQ